MSEKEPTPRQKPLEDGDDTSLGEQPWAAWLVAGLGVILIVIVVYLALERSAEMARRQAAEQAALPVVGGMVVTPAAPVADSPATATPSADASDGATLGATVLGTETAVAPDEPTEEAGDAVDAPTEEAVEAEVATATPVPTPTPTTQARPTSAPRVPAVAPTVFAPGDRVASENRQLTLFADASVNAPVLDAVTPGSVLVVLEPSGDYSEYPVLRGGQNWVRVRAGDGLAGWVLAEALTRLP